jgi:translation initiation factor IF-3
LGIVETYQALDMAKERGLDLVEIAPMAKPPVCRIIDFGKYLYQKSKQGKGQKTKQKRIEIKGVRISLRTGQHDLKTKAKQTEKFLKKGDKIRIEIILKGREKSFQFQNLAKEKLQEFIKSVPIETIIEKDIKREGRGFNMIIGKKEHK